jgi:hypothetical protein
LTPKIKKICRVNVVRIERTVPRADVRLLAATHGDHLLACASWRHATRRTHDRTRTRIVAIHTTTQQDVKAHT